MKLFIGCSASEEIDKKYKEQCQELAHILAPTHDLVFGGGTEGMTGILYQEFQKHNRKIINISAASHHNQFEQDKMDQFIETDTVFERTAELVKKSEAILFLPGGLGTIYEIFAVIEEKRTNHIPHPIIIYDPHNYYQELKALLEKIYQESFSPRNTSELYEFATTKEQLLKILERKEEQTWKK